MTKSCVNDFESKLSSFDLQIFVSIESNQKDFLLISRLQIPFPTYKCWSLWTHEKTPHVIFTGIFHINIPTPNLTTWWTQEISQKLYCEPYGWKLSTVIPPSFSRRLHLKNGRVFPKPEGGCLLFLFWVQNFRWKTAVQLWEGTIFFRHFLKATPVTLCVSSRIPPPQLSPVSSFKSWVITLPKTDISPEKETFQTGISSEPKQPSIVRGHFLGEFRSLYSKYWVGWTEFDSTANGSWVTRVERRLMDLKIRPLELIRLLFQNLG